MPQEYNVYWTIHLFFKAQGLDNLLKNLTLLYWKKDPGFYIPAIAVELYKLKVRICKNTQWVDCVLQRICIGTYYLRVSSIRLFSHMNHVTDLDKFEDHSRSIDRIWINFRSSEDKK